MDVAVFHRTISMQDPNRLWGESYAASMSPTRTRLPAVERMASSMGCRGVQPGTTLAFAVRRAPNVTDYRRADDSADPGPVPQDVRGIQHCDRAAIAAHDEAFPGGGGMSHRATVHVGDVTHVGNGETDVCHLMAPGEN